ncbi:FadR family transcriptional regulator [Catenulispora sp. NF23]|uniref:FadR family transcriptional regulator n=1 Tax=Catenulispora pinistramenti TaxID=2705254 RepID=A0ABS5KPP7_9ACTN|nr:GntR family transcriptional regulator [Catenulispora pinistramenti]MBS2539220.1 FadR family transcriptional regulator [Catenulispora pinistramenti]MBS2548015.1 FadR family transcriptional regulator [Catenulispora pinistramenti]
MFPLQDPAPVTRQRVADQIVEDLRTRILDGSLPDGSKLPAERELAAHYDVSAPTVREAIRVLTAMGLIRMRNGARATVTAQGGSLLALSISSVVQFEKMQVRDVLGLLGALNAYAAELAAQHATDAELAEFKVTAARTLETGDTPRMIADLKAFFDQLAEMSHNPLLTALCRCITEIQLGLAAKVAGSGRDGSGGPGSGRDGSGQDGSARDGFGAVAASVAETRVEIADALADRDAIRAVSLVREYHRRVVDRVQSLPRAKELAESDPGLRQVLAGWLNENVRLAGAAEPRQR